MRKIIDFKFAPFKATRKNIEYLNMITALCDDGTLWTKPASKEEWIRLDDIPQDPVAQTAEPKPTADEPVFTEGELIPTPERYSIAKVYGPEDCGLLEVQQLLIDKTPILASLFNTYQVGEIYYPSGTPLNTLYSIDISSSFPYKTSERSIGRGYIGVLERIVT